MNLTPTEQQAVKEASEEYSSNYIYAHDRKLIEAGFAAGVSFALSTLFEPRCVAFAEWVHKNTLLNESTVNQWCYKGEYYTTKELYTIYQEQLNKQQDEPV